MELIHVFKFCNEVTIQKILAPNFSQSMVYCMLSNFETESLSIIHSLHFDKICN